MKNFSWSQYFSEKKDGGHRFQNEDFLLKEAKEKIFLMAGGKSILDFGCGSGDLLIYFIPEFEEVVGVDFSKSMLKKAQERIQNYGYLNVKLIHADDISVWDKTDQSYDRIISIQVIQFFSLYQIEKFIFNASKKLNRNGKIIFFDIIDPRIVNLWMAGLFSKNSSFLKVSLKLLIIKIFELIHYKPTPPNAFMGYFNMGNYYHPDTIEKIAQKYGFEMEYVKSI